MCVCVYMYVCTHVFVCMYVCVYMCAIEKIQLLTAVLCAMCPTETSGDTFSLSNSPWIISHLSFSDGACENKEHHCL